MLDVFALSMIIDLIRWWRKNPWWPLWPIRALWCELFHTWDDRLEIRDKNGYLSHWRCTHCSRHGEYDGGW